jgi:predicted nucleic acid-binding protein
VSALVVDASIALSWCFDDEATPASDAIFQQVRSDGAIVPTLWYLELGNSLLYAERRGRIASGDVAIRLDRIAKLPIETDTEVASRAWREVLSLARIEGLTTYDATYLELAVRRGLPLATKDDALREATRRLGVPVLP